MFCQGFDFVNMKITIYHFNYYLSQLPIHTTLPSLSFSALKLYKQKLRKQKTISTNSSPSLSAMD